MAAVSTTVHHVTPIKTLDHSDEEPYSPNTRDTTSPDYPEDEKPEDRPLTSSFSIHNVLKKEREDASPENVFSTDKLLQNTPNFEERISSPRNSPSPSSPRYDNDDHQSNPDSVRAEISVDDDVSCCSDDTVLSVGNEAPLSSFNSPGESISKSNSPGTPPQQNLTSFKHIQTHLNAISQLSQNLNMNQPLLLRPNPITPNPLMFLNQTHLLFQNPLLSQEVKPGLMPSRIPVPNPNLNLNNLSTNPPQGNPFAQVNFSLRQTKNHDFRPSRNFDENRRLNLMTPQSPEHDSHRDLQNCLKFSIDNILKADFGRRITDPLHKRKTKSRNAEPKIVKEVPPKSDGVLPPVESRVPEVKNGDKGAIDLSKADEGASNQGSTTSSTSGDGPMVWPAWVYCTRYSDRPSSGEYNCFLLLYISFF